MKIWFSPYALQPKSVIGGVAGVSPRQGCLLKVEDDQYGIGFADCHPWPTLGDASLPDQLKLLAQGKTTPLTERSIFFARIDGAARAEKRNLFAGLDIPSSHWLIPDLLHVDPLFIERARKLGFLTFKVKLGKGLLQQLAALEKLVPSFEHTNLRLRLDTNALPSSEEIDTFLSHASSRLLSLIDFIEDPTLYHPETWNTLQRTYNLRCAKDRGSDDGKLEGVSVIIIKPAIQNPLQLVKIAAQRSCSAVVTSYLDHPFGQLTAAYAAAVASRNFPGIVKTCGLVSHPVFESNLFSEALSIQHAKLVPPQGFGFGFDEQLLSLAWQHLL